MCCKCTLKLKKTVFLNKNLSLLKKMHVSFCMDMLNFLIYVLHDILHIIVKSEALREETWLV